MNVAAVRAAMRPAPAATPANNVVPLRSVPQDAPAPPGDPADAQPAPRASTTRWTRYAATLGAGLTVTCCAASIRSGGNEPNMPDDSDVDGLRDALDEMLRQRFGDGAAPWWLEAALAVGGVYSSMRIGARPLHSALTPDAPAAAAAPPAPPPPVAPAARPSFANHFPPPMSVTATAGGSGGA